MVNDTYHENMSGEKLDALLEELEIAMPGRQLIMTFPVTATSHTLADYRARGGYATLEKALREMTPQDVTKEVTASGMLGPRRRRVPGRPQVGASSSSTTASRTTCAPTPTKASRARSRTAGSSRTRRTCCSSRC